VKEQSPFRLRRICIAVFLTVAALMGFYKFITSVENLPQSIGRGIGAVISALAPVILGLVISYFLQPLVEWEEKVFAKCFRMKDAARKNLAIVIAILLFLAFLGTMVGFLLPVAYDNASDLVLHADDWLLKAKDGLVSLQDKFPILAFLDAEALHQSVLDAVNAWVEQADWGALALQAANVAGKIFSGLFNLLVGIILAFYILHSGHELGSSIRKTVTGWVGGKRLDGFFDCLDEINHILGKYVGGKMLQSFIMFLMILPFFLVLKVPYAPLMALVVALTNLIPFIGPFLGGTVPVFLALMISFPRALLTLAAVLLVQQIDNYLVEPKLIGKIVGMHSFWVIAWILIGSSLFGLWGTLLAVPMAAVLKAGLDRIFHHKDCKAHENLSGN